MNLSKLIEGYRYDKGPTYSAKTLESYDVVFKHVFDYFGDVGAHHQKHLVERRGEYAAKRENQ